MAIFAKRHCEAIASVMQGAHPGTGLSDDNRAVVQWSETCKDLAEMFERDNPQFDIIRFMRACKPGANVQARCQRAGEEGGMKQIKGEIEGEIALVYQAGIANLFDVTQNPRQVRRLVQANFRTCENIARGAAMAGVTVRSWSCNEAGDISDTLWSIGLDDCPFRDQANPVTSA